MFEMMKYSEMKLWEGEIPHLLPEADTPNCLECYVIQCKEPRPAVIIYPGGGYNIRAPHEAAPIAHFYNSRGYHAFVCHYRTSPNRYPAELMDAQRAIKLVRANAEAWHIDSDRLFTLGFSAGGHLCALTATMPDVAKVGDAYDDIPVKPSGAILCYSVVNLMEEFGHAGSGRSLFGRENYDEMAPKFCAEKLVDDDTCPCFFWHTSDDNCVNVQNAFAFGRALNQHGIKFEMHVYPAGNHGLGLAPDRPDIRQWAAQSADWIDRNFPKK
ncbi:MAG: alpha/beta hydrolase [Clostridia bacterium]|nr:alpha/beta hydrolase [Clostridia bacterium]